jgi:hypothetical protein
LYRLEYVCRRDRTTFAHLAHADNNDEGAIKLFAKGQIAADAKVVTNGHAGYNKRSLGSSHQGAEQSRLSSSRNAM